MSIPRAYIQGRSHSKSSRSRKPTSVEVIPWSTYYNYYAKFIPNLAGIVYNPLNQLLEKILNGHRHQPVLKPFKAVKQALNSTKVLAHYDPSLPITMAGDASAYGIGSVISHVLPDSSEKPIALCFLNSLI